MSDYVSDPGIWLQARQRLPLPLLMTLIGDGAHTKKNAPCPFCGAEKGKWAVFERAGKNYFKCHAPDCQGNENDAGHGEIAYLMLRKGLSKKEAGAEYLRLAVPDLVPHLFAKPAQPKKPPVEYGLVIENEEADAADQIPGIDNPEQEAPPPPNQPRDGDAKNLWHALWKKLPLTIADHAKLRVDRGFSDETIEALGFRSNNQGNLHHLEALASEFSMDELIAEGIYKEVGSRGVKPSGQFFGWGITGKKDPKSGKNIFEQTEPIIIPYLDANGVPFYLRPHKGGVAKPKDELEDIELWEEEAPDTCAAHVYCPFLLTELIHLNDGLCVLTEGEYKAAALWQCDIAAIACPGIQFVRNMAFRDQLIALLRTFGVTDLVIIFDNEVKDDPSLPSYKADPFRRWDTPMWAEYTAIDLRDFFASTRGSCRIGWLPDEFRVNGKADCDGILAAFVRKFGLVEGTRQARRIFMTTIEAASDRPGLDLFPSEARRIVECKLQRLFYKPLVNVGGSKEITLARRFAEFSPTLQGPVDKHLADIFRGLRGCYYKRNKPVQADRDALQKLKDQLTSRIDELKKTKDKTQAGPAEWERKRRTELRTTYAQLAAVWEKLKGLPEPISNFYLSCDYKLHTIMGEVHRLVDVKDSKERSATNGSNGHTHALRRLSPTDLARLADFRKWCYATGEAVWAGGDKELQALVQDMDHHSFLRDIHEITTYGYHADSKVWFFGDVAFDPDGKPIHPDQSNIFWYDGIGYQIEATLSDRGSSFVQGAPKLLSPQESVPPLEEPDPAAIFRQFSEDLFQTIGGYDGWLIMGLAAAYAIGPELVRAGGHPGMWLFGKMSGGKTTVARWIMRLWGFKELGGIRIGESSTPTAMNRFLAQYCSLPVWMDEYRRLTVDAQREEVLRGAFDRSSGAKGIADHSNRTRNATILTTPIVSGESSSGDAATRSRYGHVSVSAHKRLGDGVARYNRVQNEQLHFYHLGFWLMKNRKEYASRCISLLDDWMSNSVTRQHIVNERVRLVHGTAYVCFHVMAEMLGLDKSIYIEPVAAELDQETARRRAISTRTNEFMQYLFKHGEQALADVIEETFLSQFWRDIIAGIQLSKIQQKFFVTRYVKANEEGRLFEVEADTPDAFHVCYVAPDAVFAAYQQFKAGRREDTPQQLSDIRREMEKEPYWVPYPKAKDLRVHRINMGGHKHTCWVINLSRAPGASGKLGSHLFPFAEDLENALTLEPADATET